MNLQTKKAPKGAFFLPKKALGEGTVMAVRTTSTTCTMYHQGQLKYTRCFKTCQQLFYFNNKRTTYPIRI